MTSKQPTVLAVDDEHFLLEAYQLALAGSGVNLLTCDDGKTAIDLALEHRPELLFIDLKMPSISGVDVLKELNKMGFHTVTYIISAFAEEYLHELEALKQSGYDFEIGIKPLHPREIRTIVDSVISQSEEPQQNDTKLEQAQEEFYFLIIGQYQKAVQLKTRLEVILNNNLAGRYKLKAVEVSSLPPKDVNRDSLDTSFLNSTLPTAVVDLITEIYGRDDVSLLVKQTSNGRLGILV